MDQICPTCGTTCDAAVEFCPNRECGAYLGWDTGRVRAPARSGSSEGPSPSPKAGVTATVSGEAVEVEPGHPASLTLRIRNTGTIVDEYVVDLGGSAAGFATASPARVSVYPDTEGRTTISLVTSRAPSPAAGAHGLQVVVWSPVTGVGTQLGCRVTVNPFRRYDVTLTPSLTRGRRRTFCHELAVVNDGNTALPVTAGIGDESGRVTFSEPGATFEVAGGQREALRVTGRTRWKWFGAKESLPFAAMVRETDSRPGARAQVVKGERVQLPLIPRWAPPAVVALVAAVILAATFLTRTQQVGVPSVTGDRVTVAALALQRAGFLVKKTWQSSADVTAGHVIGTQPAADTQAPKGSGVTMLVSSGGPETSRVVPAVLGISVPEAKRRIRKADLKVEQGPDIFSDEVSQGLVARVDPGAGTPYPAGQTVTIWASKGSAASPTSGATSSIPGGSPNPPVSSPPGGGGPTSPSSGGGGTVPSLTMPHLTGAVGAAVTALAHLGIIHVQTSKVPSATVPSGQIVRTDPAPGAPLVPGQKVTLLVSTGPQQVQVHLADVADQATWFTQSAQIAYDGTPSADGYAAPATGPLQDGVVHGSSLLTVPPQQPGGWIRGGFALGRQIAAGDRFTADVGFTQAGGTATFIVTALMPDGSIPELGRYTGSTLHHLKVDLSPAAGATVLRLRVDEDPNVGDDQAVWVDPTLTSGG